MDDNLYRTVQEKRDAGYPFDNILFQTPQRGILYQNGEQVFDVDITDPTRLIVALQHLFAAPPAALENWHAAVAEFKEKVPALGKRLAELIAEQHEKNPQFVTVFTGFYEQCRTAINLNLSIAYNYGLLHHPDYREKYQANLKRDLPHIPFAEDFWGFANAGSELAALHVNYESVPKSDGLKYIETPGLPIDWRVEKMKLSRDKTQLKYNDFLMLDGIPEEVYHYRLGNRAALEWIVDQYRVKTDKRSGIVNDPNRADQPQYIVDLIARVVTVSLKTMEVVKGLPEL